MYIQHIVTHRLVNFACMSICLSLCLNLIFMKFKGHGMGGNLSLCVAIICASRVFCEQLTCVGYCEKNKIIKIDITKSVAQ